MGIRMKLTQFQAKFPIQAATRLSPAFVRRIDRSIYSELFLYSQSFLLATE